MYMKPLFLTLIFSLILIPLAVAQTQQGDNGNLHPPVKTLEQQVDEALNTSFIEIYDARLRVSRKIYETFASVLDAPLVQSNTTEPDTAFYSVFMRKDGDDNPWVYERISYTVNDFGSEDATRIETTDMAFNATTQNWRISSRINQESPRTTCDPFCSDYQRRNYNVNGQITGGFRTLRYTDYTDSYNWNTAIQDFAPSMRSSFINNDRNQTLESWQRFYNESTDSFVPGSYSEYEYDDLGRTIMQLSLSFSPDSVYTSGSRSEVAYNADHRPTFQLSQTMPFGHPDTTTWVNQQRVLYSYGSTQMEQRQEVWSTEDEAWSNYILGYGYYTNINYPDSSVTLVWDAAQEAFTPLAKIAMEYDAANNMILRLTYIASGGDFFLTGRTEFTYNEDNKLTFERTYGGTGGELFKTQERRFEYNELGIQFLSETLNFTVNGTVSTGTRQLLRYDGETYLGYESYTYNPVDDIWQLSGYYYNSRVIGNRVSQINSMSSSSWSGTTYQRNLLSFEDNPVVFNDGPVLLRAGETVRFTLFAIDTDLSEPDVSITNLPDGATYDPETRTFEWAVTEVNPTSMIVRAESAKGMFETEVFFIDAASVTSLEDSPEHPSHITLLPNFPNPFNPATTLAFELSTVQEVSLEVFDVIGRKVAVAASGVYPAGHHTVSFDGRSLASGVYMVVLRTANEVHTRNMLLLK